MALMQEEDTRELLQTESSLELQDTNSRARSTGWAKAKRYIAISVAVVVVAYTGLAAALHHHAKVLSATEKKAKLTKLTDEIYMEERTHACDTMFDINEVIHRNLDNKGPDSGEEGVIMTGTFIHGTDPPVALEMHFHALTEYRAPDRQHNKMGNAIDFTQPPSGGGDPGKMAIIRMGQERDSKFKIELVSPGTHDAYTVPQLATTFFDLDGHYEECEGVTVEPANDVVMAQDMLVNVDLSRREEGIVKFTNQVGRAALPSSIDSFSHEDQRRHAAEAVFYHTSTLNITLHTGPCGDRDFAFIGRANVQCGAPPEGGDPPPVDIETAAPPPVIITASAAQFCLFCWISPSLSFIPPCSDTEVFWARICE